MRKDKILLVIGFLVATAVSCSNQGFVKNNGSSQKKNQDRSRGAMDPGKYIDVTDSRIDAAFVTKNDLLEYCANRTYRNSSSSIKAGPEYIVFSTEESMNEKLSGKKVYVKFRYILESASPNCVYIKPVDVKEVEMTVDGKVYEPDFLPGYSYFVALYGFGENRVEVSSVLDGVSFMNCGTFWFSGM